MLDQGSHWVLGKTQASSALCVTSPLLINVVLVPSKNYLLIAIHKTRWPSGSISPLNFHHKPHWPAWNLSHVNHWGMAVHPKYHIFMLWICVFCYLCMWNRPVFSIIVNLIPINLVSAALIVKIWINIQWYCGLLFTRSAMFTFFQ